MPEPVNSRSIPGQFQAIVGDKTEPEKKRQAVSPGMNGPTDE
jgi:hypothetical protein